MMNESDIFSAIGEEGFARLVAAFYRQIPGDDLLGPMYPPDDLAGARRGRIAVPCAHVAAPVPSLVLLRVRSTSHSRAAAADDESRRMNREGG